MKKRTENQIVLVPLGPEGQQQVRALIDFDTHELTAFRAVNRPGNPLVCTLAPRGLMDDVEALMGAYLYGIVSHRRIS